MNKPFIALEIHDATLWEPSRVLPILKTMENWGYNALVLHQNDLLDVCTQLGLSANYGVADLRLKKVRNNAAWLNKLTTRLAQFDARLFLEIKEPSFHDYALEEFPDLIGPDGYPDPMHPSWAGFCRKKVDDLLDRVPGLGGLIVNLSSPESRVSMPDHLATHDGTADIADWFDRMIDAFNAPLMARQKDLFVRDFSYTTDLQSDVIGAINRCNGTVGASVKATAHDYFPEFPENPVARRVKGKGKVILEFESFGEHMGWGVIPNCRIDELRARMKGYRDMGAAGFLNRTSWEAITGANALDSLSAVNVYSLPLLAKADVAAEDLVTDWLDEQFGLTGDLAHRVSDLLRDSWQIPAAAYWEGQVFPRHSCVPSTWQEGWISMDTNGMGRRDRQTGIDPNDTRLSEDSRRHLFDSKENATALARRITGDAKNLVPELPKELARLFDAFDWLPYFARQFELATKATFYAARSAPGDWDNLPELRSGLLELAQEIEHALNNGKARPHHDHVLFDPEQIRTFLRSLPNSAALP